jgi:hypothetical protein
MSGLTTECKRAKPTQLTELPPLLAQRYNEIETKVNTAQQYDKGVQNSLVTNSVHFSYSFSVYFSFSFHSLLTFVPSRRTF